MVKEYRKPVLKVWGSAAELTRADDVLIDVSDVTIDFRRRLSWFYVIK
jgi:hypothetical protein